MSNIIFTPKKSSVVVTRPRESALVSINLDNKQIGTDIKLIVTGLTLELSGNYQVLHTIGDFIYFYAFGDRIGTLNLTGVGLLQPCANDNGAEYNLVTAYEHYQKEKAGKKDGKAINIVLKSESKEIKLWGFLTGLRVDVADTQAGGVGYWALRFEVVQDTN